MINKYNIIAIFSFLIIFGVTNYLNPNDLKNTVEYSVGNVVKQYSNEENNNNNIYSQKYMNNNTEYTSKDDDDNNKNDDKGQNWNKDINLNSNIINRDINTCSPSEKLNYYDFEKSITHHLRKKYLDEIPDNLVDSLKDKNILYTSWNIGEWEDKYIKYNYTKMKNSNGITYTKVNGQITNIEATEADKTQTPLETIVKKSGVCRDYAILTGALLFKCGYNKIYIFNIDFKKGSGHVFTAIKYNGIYYAIDQHIPITTVNEHLNKLEKEQGEIKNIEYYEVKNRNGHILVTKYEYKNNFNYDNQNNLIDYNSFSNLLMDNIIQKYPNLNKDSNINNLDKKYLPKEYLSGITLTYTYPNQKIDKNLKDKWAEYISNNIIKDDNHLSKYNRIWVSVKENDNNIIVKIYLGKST